MPYEVTVTKIDNHEVLGGEQRIYSQRTDHKPDILAIAGIVNMTPPPVVMPRFRKKREEKPKAPVRPPEQKPFNQVPYVNPPIA